MKKILMLSGNPLGKNKNKFVELVSANFQKRNTTMELGALRDISIYFGRKSEIFCGDRNLADYDLIVFRGVSVKDRSIASAFAITLESIGVRYIDHVYGTLGTTENKLVSFAKLYSEGLPMPKSYFTSGELSENLYKKLSLKLGSPFVAKDLIKQRGLGVFLIDSKETFLKLKGKFIFQTMLEKKHEYRVLILGGRVGVFEEKISGSTGEFRNNVALGAKEIFLDKGKISKKIEDICIKASAVLKLDIAGADVVEDVAGKYYLLEVNRGPGLTYSENSPEFKEIAEYLEKNA